MAFDHHQLRAFLAVVDHGSLGRAALAVHQSQPTLSRIVMGMEARLGQKLFERGARGMTLTAAGEMLVPHARLLLFEMGQASDALDALQGLQHGVVRLGTVATVARSVLPQAIASLIHAAPGLRVEMLERPDGELTTALLRRQIDLMIAARVPVESDIVMVRPVRYEDRYAPFCAAAHPIAQRAPVDPRHLLNERWTMPGPGATPRDLFDMTMRAWCGAVPEVAVETGSIIGMIAIVAQTRLLGWLPRPLLAGDLATGAITLLDVPALGIARHFFVYRRARGILSRAATRFLDMLPDLDGMEDAANKGRL